MLNAQRQKTYTATSSCYHQVSDRDLHLILVLTKQTTKAGSTKEQTEALSLIISFALGEMQLTTTGPVVGIQGVVGRAPTNKTSNWHSQAEVGAVPVAGSTLIPPCLPRRVEDEDVHHVIQVALNDGAVLATGFVGSLNAASAPVCPVDVILVLS
jgi:hypothetical protein